MSVPVVADRHESPIGPPPRQGRSAPAEGSAAPYVAPPERATDQTAAVTPPTPVTAAPLSQTPAAEEPARPDYGSLPDPTTRPMAEPVVLPSSAGSTAAVHPASVVHAPLLDPQLALAAEILDDLEKVRIGNANRLRILTTLEPDEDGVVRGFGLDESHPDVARLAAMVKALGELEHDATLNLQRAMRKHPLGPWVKAQVGIGEKQAARLLAAIGDPYWNTASNRPRTVSALWAYCGLHVLPASQTSSDSGHGVGAGGARYDSGPALVDTQALAAGDDSGDPGHSSIDNRGSNAGVAARRRRGQRANWSTTAKTRAYLIALSCIKQARSPYRAVYDARRARTAATHPDWTDGHSHNDALRVTSKAILRDLWREAKRVHEADAHPA
jgi:hypothetical protein